MYTSKKATGACSTVPVVIALLVFTGCHSVVKCLEYRLDTTVLPDVYDITIKPYLLPEDGDKQFTFDGKVNITLHAVTADVKNITLHLNFLHIKTFDIGVLLYDAAGNLLSDAVSKIYTHLNTHIITVELNYALKLNTNYTLYFNYEAVMRTDLAGFYRTSYVDADGKLKWIGVTQSQRIDARTIVPCFDEPAMKAVFKMKINRHKSFNSVFNTRLLKSIPDGADRYIDHFEATPRMSSYLLAFVISEFTPRGNATLSVIARPEYYEKTEFSHKVAERTLAAYGDHFQSPYTELGNPIMQMLATPAFPHNGMENWGLIIYKDAVLVQEPGYTDGWSNKQYTTSIIAHETSHMWFGNSVTFAWWSYFWLNEAFARYYEYFFTHQLYPEFEMDQQFVVNQMHLIFGTDATSSTQPLTTREDLIQSPSQIASKFSGITYAKGACIVRMFRHAMGPDNFDNAIRDYLKENHLKNTVPADLFVHLERHWPENPILPLSIFFNDWTAQVGFPVLKVNFYRGTNRVYLEQERFLLNLTDGSDATLKYTIPITYTASDERNFTNLTPEYYMVRKNSIIPLGYDRNIRWVIFNIQQTGFYRVLYDNTTYQYIRADLMQANHSDIHVINRAQLIDDLFNFAYADMLDYQMVFEFLEYMITETDYLPWYAAFSGLTRIAQRTPLERQSDLGAFLTNITATAYEKLRFEAPNDTVLDVYNRNRIVKWACKYGNKMCEQDALAAHTAWMESGIKPTPDFRETSYCCGNRVGGNEKYFLDLYEVYKRENITSEKEMILRAMGCTREQHTVLKYYTLILSHEIPVSQKQSALNSLFSENPENVTPVFKMMNDTIEELAEALGSWSTTANVISNIANYFTSAEQRNDLEQFIQINGHLFGTSKATLTKALETVDYNLSWTANRLTNLFKYLERPKTNNAATNTLTFTLMVFTGFVYRIIA